MRGRSSLMATSAHERIDAFEAERPRLFALGYRMLGSITDAEDLLQEAWIRWDAARDVDNPAAWLTTVTTRLAIDRLRSAQRRREQYVGEWLPEPLVTGEDDPAVHAEMSESLTIGFLTVLERLEPVDRAVFLLREVFGVSYREVAAAVGKSEAACRQINKRARDRVHRERPALSMPEGRRDQLLDAFLAAVLSGDPAVLEPLLMEDVVHVSDGGAARHAARRPVVGRARVARFLVNIGSRISPADVTVERVAVNGQPGFIVQLGGEPLMILEVEYRASRIERIHAVLEPDKLAAALRRRES